MNKPKHYHLVGVCGVSMSGIAQFLLDQGHKVTGSDIKKCTILSEDGKKIQSLEHKEDNVSKDTDVVIMTSAITEGSSGWREIEMAKKLGIKILKRSEMIGELVRDTVSIGVTGMHGKTTTSSMIAYILQKAELSPSYLIGGVVRDLKSSAKLGKAIKPIFDKDKKYLLPNNVLKNGLVNYFVVEACEYDRSFLDIKPKIGVITNIDKEHLDYYKGGLPEIKQAFKKFIKQLPEDGLLVVWQEDPYVMPLIKSAKCKVKLVSKKKIWPGLNLKVPGVHNQINATLAARVAHEIGINSETIKKALNEFSGAGRRFEVKGKYKGAVLIDDYGHHPTEIKATINSAKQKYPDSKIVIVFQPHQQQRTKVLYNDFVECFKGIDELIITDVYLIAGREKNIGENLAKKMAEDIAKKGINVKYISGYGNIVKYLNENIDNNDIVITQGATDIYKVGEELLKEENAKS